MIDDIDGDLLWFGYRVEPGALTTPVRRVFDHLEGTATEARRPAVEDLRRAHRDAVSACLARAKPPHVVPISGGRDSRLLLAELVRQIGPSDIRTYTFGLPRTLDFEIGREVARTLGVTHEAIDLSTIQHGVDRIRRVIGVMDARVADPDVPPWDQVIDVLGVEGTHWSGFLGDPLSGLHMGDDPDPSWDGTQARFAGGRAQANRNASFHAPGHEPTGRLPRSVPVGQARMPWGQQLNLVVRQEHYIRPAMAPDTFDFVFPFTEPPWLDVFLAERSGDALARLRRCYEDLLLDYDALSQVRLKDATPKPMTSSVARVRAGVARRSRRVARQSNRWAAFERRRRLNYHDWERSLARSLSFRSELDEIFGDHADLAEAVGATPADLDLTASDPRRALRFVSWLLVREARQ